MVFIFSFFKNRIEISKQKALHFLMPVAGGK